MPPKMSQLRRLYSFPPSGSTFSENPASTEAIETPNGTNEPSNGGSEADSVADGLCPKCSQLKISIDKFIVQNEGLSPGLRCYDPSGLGTVALGFLDEIYRRTTCPFCRLIFAATYQHGGLSSSIGYDGLSMVGERVHCRMEWQLDGREGTEDMPSHQWKAKTRRIRLFITGNAFPAVHVVLMAKTLQATPSFLGRRIDPSQIDVSLLRRWMALCERCHGTCCNQPLRQPKKAKELIFIDVEENGLTRRKSTCHYLILSYLWGAIDPHSSCLRKDNVDRLLQPGSLSDIPLPKTVADAMQFCKSLGERYLWVDRLCIVQDDMDSWSESAAIMDVIYANSTLNICAASGCDSEAGLPGLYGQTRRTNQHVATLAGMDVVATRIPEVDIARTM